jgi:tetratricopeptide (TPR) repeat protein
MHNFQQAVARGGAAFELRCFAENCHSPFHPLIALLESLFRFTPTDTPEQKFNKLTAHLDPYPFGRDTVTVSLLGKLLSLPLPLEHQVVEMTAQEVKFQTFSILSEVMLSAMADKPTLLIWEDIHWADHSSLEYLSQFFEAAKSAGIVLLLTARPDFTHSWMLSSVDTLTLQPLGKQEVEQMIASLDATIPDDTVARIIERADGIPLFVEEIVTNITSGSVIEIPATLQDLLTARIDNLGRAKTTAQLAACLGREFDLQLLQAASVCSEQELENHLTLLFETGLLIEPEQTTGQFKHALIRDVCYQSQTRDDRRSAHQRIAQALLTEFPHLAETRQELVAHHYFAGGNAAKAADYWAMAGRRDLAVGANMEAIEHLNAALEALGSIPHQDDTHTRLKTMLYLNLGAAWMSAGGYGCLEAREAHLQAMALSGAEKDVVGLFATLRRLWMADYMYLGSQAASEMAEQMLRLAQQSDDPVELQAAHDSYGVSIGSMGDLETGFYHYTQAAALYQPEHHAEMVSRFGENVAINNGVHLAMTLWIRGFSDQSWARMEATLDIARAQEHPHSLCIALYGCALISRWRKEVDVSARYVEESIALADQFEMPFWQLSAAVDWAWVTAMRGENTESLALSTQLNANPEIPGAAKILFYQQLADGLVHLSLYSEALEILDGVITLADERNERYLEADYHRMKGICLLETSPNDYQAAESCFNKALSLSRQQGALSIEGQTTISMAKLWRRTSRPREATKLLQDLCDRLEECHDSRDYHEAKKLLQDWR